MYRNVQTLGYLEDKEETPVLLHPNMALRYQKEVNELRDALNDDSTRMRAADILRGLIDKIVLTPKPGEKEYAIDLHGDLAGILTVAAGKQQRITYLFEESPYDYANRGRNPPKSHPA